MLLRALRKVNDLEVLKCFKVGFAVDGSIVDAADALLGKRRVRNRANVADEEWRLLTVAYLEASVDKHRGGCVPQYALPDRSVIPYPRALKMVRERTEHAAYIISQNKARIIELLDDITRELGQPCEESAVV